MTRLALATLQRAAVVDLLTGYAASASISLNVFPARPRSISTPHAFIDATRETIDWTGVTGIQRNPITEVVVLWGLFDSAQAVLQRDDFVDGFLEWVTDRVHATAPVTLIAVNELQDEPTFTADWAREGQQGPYFATRFLIGGFATT